MKKNDDLRWRALITREPLLEAKGTAQQIKDCVVFWKG